MKKVKIFNIFVGVILALAEIAFITLICIAGGLKGYVAELQFIGNTYVTLYTGALSDILLTSLVAFFVLIVMICLFYLNHKKTTEGKRRDFIFAPTVWLLIFVEACVIYVNRTTITDTLFNFAQTEQLVLWKFITRTIVYCASAVYALGTAVTILFNKGAKKVEATSEVSEEVAPTKEEVTEVEEVKEIVKEEAPKAKVAPKAAPVAKAKAAPVAPKAKAAPAPKAKEEVKEEAPKATAKPAVKATPKAKAAPKAPVAPKTETNEEEKSANNIKKVIVREKTIIYDNKAQETEENDDEEIEETNVPSAATKPFEIRLDGLEADVRQGYSELKNQLLEYRNVHSRITKSAETYRFKGDLVACMTISGKGLKLYLALDPYSLDSAIYHQRDASSKKRFAAVPFVVKVKSPLSVKKALKLIDLACEKAGTLKKTRYTPVDYTVKQD